MIGERTDRRLWRPQTFGGRNIRQVNAPLIEPLWSGTRVLAHVSDDALALVDDAGAAVDRPDIEAAILLATQADSAVFDGYLSPEAARSGVGIYSGPEPRVPSPGEVARQLLVGGRNRRGELIDALEARASTQLVTDEAVAFVAVDLLLLDGDSLLGIPLLERKRLLDGVVAESDLVRIGIHVSPPVDPWLGTWRNVGFRMLAYKEANGRYHPGAPNDGWATAQIPRG